jgi:DNA repair protein RecO (recombination protein O)
MLQRTEGIVLRTTPYGEADLIVTFLTKDHGIIKVFAKSPRKVKSRFGSSLEPLTCSRISFWGKEDSALPRLTQADITYAYRSIRESLNCFLKVSELIELTLHLVPERDRSRNVFSLLMRTLACMETGPAEQLITLFYKLKLLEISGFLPRLQSCGRCGEEGDTFHLTHGTVLCENCCRDGGQVSSISPGVRTFFSTLLKWEMSKLHRLKPAEGIIRELVVLIDEHVQYVTEKNLRTKSFRVG